MVTIKFFASLREVAGCAEIALDGSSMEDVWQALSEQFAEAVVLELRGDNVRIAHNQRLLTDLDIRLQDGDELAFLPPVTGG